MTQNSEGDDNRVNEGDIAKKPLARRAWFWFVVVLVLALVIFAVRYIAKDKSSSQSQQQGSQNNQQEVTPEINKGKYTSCPSSLEGLLTYPLIEPTNIAAIGPLGWLSAGHTAPSDHNSFRIPLGDQVESHAPADGWISRLQYQWERLPSGELKSNGLTIFYTLCENVVLKLSTYKDLSPAIQGEVDSIPESDKDCREGKFKDKESVVHKVCDFETHIAVKAGDLLGHVFEMDGMENYETWAYDYRQFNPKYDKTLKYYSEGGEDIGHSFCLFDLYKGELRSKYNQLFGRYDDYSGFAARIGDPLCGTHHQEVDGTIQGTWFQDRSNPLTIIHDDIDQRKGLMAISSPLRSEEHEVGFDIVHEGTINREPSEVKVDGNTYCYTVRESRNNTPMGKVLIQLVDQEHLKAEYKSSGTCGANESFGGTAVTLDR